MINNNKSLKEEILLSKAENKNYGIIKNWHQPTPTVDQLKDIVDKSTSRPNARINYPENNQQIQYFLKQCLAVYPDIEYDLYIISNLNSRNSAPDNPGTTLHFDPTPIIHWQCRGATLWKIGNYAESKGKIKNEAGGYVWDSKWTQDPDCFIVEPGDVIWFESGVWHETENLTEKYSVIFDAIGEKNH